MFKRFKVSRTARRLKSKYHWEQLQAAEKLGAIGHRLGVPPLIEALRDPSSMVAQAAAKSLGQLGDQRAVAPLVEALTRTGREGADALLALGWQPTNESERARLAVARGDLTAAAKCGPVAIDPLLVELLCEKPDYPQRMGAASALATLSQPAVQPLIQVLADSRKYCQAREAAASALGTIGSTTAVAPLCAALKADYQPLRCAAAEALGKIKDRAALPALVEALRGAGDEFGKITARAIKHISPIAPPISELLEQLRKGIELADDLRRQTISAFGCSPPPSDAEAYCAVLKTASSWPLVYSDLTTAVDAACALGLLGYKEAAEALSTAAQCADLYGAVVQKLPGGSSQKLNEAFSFLKDKPGFPIAVMKALAETSGKMPESKSAQFFCLLTCAELRRVAAEALRRIGNGDGTGEQTGSVRLETVLKLREAILSQNALTKCCELAPINPRKVGLDHLGILRVVVYRLDGRPVGEVDLDAILMSYLVERAVTDQKFLPVQKAVTDGTFFPYPRVGFTIDLSGDAPQERIDKCEILATTEYAKEGADLRTTGHGLSADGVPYRIYFFWKA